MSLDIRDLQVRVHTSSYRYIPVHIGRLVATSSNREEINAELTMTASFYQLLVCSCEEDEIAGHIVCRGRRPFKDEEHYFGNGRHRFVVICEWEEITFVFKKCLIWFSTLLVSCAKYYVSKTFLKCVLLLWAFWKNTDESCELPVQQK